MMGILYRLARFLTQHQLIAGNIKITIEFLDPETQHRAEYILRTNVIHNMSIDPKMIQGICEGEPWAIMGLNFQVKRFEYPKPWPKFSI